MSREEFLGDAMSVAKRVILFCLGMILLSGCVHEPVRHLASDASRFVTGQTIMVDGGSVLL